MASKTAVLGGFACVLALLAAIAPALIGAGPAVGQERGGLTLAVDFAEIVRLERAPSTIVIGNPGIVDATLGDERSLILTGRAPGATNMIVLDEAGDEIASVTVRVLASPRYLTTFIHGTERRTYSCGRRCEPVLSVGDQPEHFAATQSQIQARQQFSAPAAAQ